MTRERNRWLSAFALLVYALPLRADRRPDHLLVQQRPARPRLAGLHARLVSELLRERRAARRAGRHPPGRGRRGRRLDGPRLAARAGPGAAPVPRPRRDRDAPARADGHARDRDGPVAAAVLPPAVRRARLGRPAVDRPHHVLHLVRGGRRPGAGGEHEPAARGGRARPRGVGLGRVPLRDAAADRAGGARRARCSRSRSASTTTS